MGPVKRYSHVLIFVIIIEVIEGGFFARTALQQPLASSPDLNVIPSEVDGKVLLLKKRQSVPLFSPNPFFSSIPSFSIQKQDVPKNTNHLLINSQAPIRIPFQQFSPQLPNFSNNPFLSVSTVTVPSIVSTSSAASAPISVPLQQLSPQPPNFSNNPFLSGSTVTFPPLTSTPVATSAPSYENNPFLNVQNQVVHSNVVQISTSPKPVTTPEQINTNNPFLNPQNTHSMPSTELPSDKAPQPVELPVQAEQNNQLRGFCAKARGQFASGRCNTFVNCWDYVAVEQSCPPGLVFNFAGYCDYPQNVDCLGRTFEAVLVPQPPETVSIVFSQQPQAPLEESKHNTPSQPISQGENVGVNGQSPSCNNSSPVEVVNKPTIDYVPAPVDARLKQKCLKVRGQFPSDMCNRYVDCWDDSVAEHECPQGLYFSEKGYCDYLYNVNCQSRTVLNVNVDSSCPRPDGTFKDVANCSRYFVCTSNVVSGKYECPLGLHFNDIIGVCDYPHNVDCNREPFVYHPPQVADTIQKVPAGILDAVKDCLPGKIFRLSNDCSSAVLCRKGMTEVVYCPNGLGYDAPTDRCLPLNLAKCQDN